MSHASLERVADLCRTWVDQDVHKALCVLVARRGVVCLHEAFGRLGPHGGPPLERDSIFPMMSITKPITATLLMTLVEDGVVGLTRPVQEYIPEFRGEGKELVCVHHLLTHTSGIVDEEFAPADALTRTDPADIPLSYKPGAEMVYANYNFTLLGDIVRRAGGQPLSDFAKSRLFEPLHMDDTSYVLPEEHVQRTIGWVIALGALDTTSREFRAAPLGSGGVHSTAMDIAVFAQMLLNGGSYGDARILSRGTVAEMTRDQIPGVKARVGPVQLAEASWGYSWSITGNEKWPGWPTFTKGTFQHSGAGAMLLWIDPATELVGVYLSVCRYRGFLEPITNADLFVNAVTAAVED